jgi:hypothetical protein
MTRDEAIAFIKFGLGNRTGTELDTAIIARLQQAQRLLEQGRSLPYFLKLEDQVFAVPLGTGIVPFPALFLREVQNETFHYTSTQNGRQIYLTKVDPQEGNRSLGGDQEVAGRPAAYAIRKDGFQFFPERDKAYDLIFSYYRSGGALDSNVTDNAWLVKGPDILIGRAGSLIAEVIAHDRAKAAFDAQFSAGWNGAFAEGIMREEENDPLVMGAKR